MEIINVIITSICSIIVLFILTKLMGCKQVSELTMFDYINGITIGSIAAEMATSLGGDFLNPLIAMIVYALIVTVISIFTNKSIPFRRLVVGKSLILMDNDKLYRNNFAKARMDLNEFLVECRIGGIFNLNDIQTAVFEPNGHVSFLLKPDARPATPKDLSLNPQLQKPSFSLVLDGKIMEQNLKQSGNDINWLKSELKSLGFNNEKDVFYAFCDENNKLTAYKNQNIKTLNDIFQ